MRTISKQLKQAIETFQDHNDPERIRFHLKQAFSALVSKEDFNDTSKGEAFHVYSNLLELMGALDQLRRPLKKVRSTGDEFFH